jgi:hypothetical protein
MHVFVVQVRRGPDRAGEPVQHHVREQWSRLIAASGSSDAGCVHSLNFSTIHASWPTGEWKVRRPSYGSGGLLEVTAAFVVPPVEELQATPLDVGEAGALVLRDLPVRDKSVGCRVDVQAHDVVGIYPTQLHGYELADVTTLTQR